MALTIGTILGIAGVSGFLFILWSIGAAFRRRWRVALLQISVGGLLLFVSLLLFLRVLFDGVPGAPTSGALTKESSTQIRSEVSDLMLSAKISFLLGGIIFFRH